MDDQIREDGERLYRSILKEWDELPMGPLPNIRTALGITNVRSEAGRNRLVLFSGDRRLAEIKTYSFASVQDSRKTWFIQAKKLWREYVMAREGSLVKGSVEYRQKSISEWEVGPFIGIRFEQMQEGVWWFESMQEVDRRTLIRRLAPLMMRPRADTMFADTPAQAFGVFDPSADGSNLLVLLFQVFECMLPVYPGSDGDEDYRRWAESSREYLCRSMTRVILSEDLAPLPLCRQDFQGMRRFVEQLHHLRQRTIFPSDPPAPVTFGDICVAFAYFGRWLKSAALMEMDQQVAKAFVETIRDLDRMRWVQEFR